MHCRIHSKLWDVDNETQMIFFVKLIEKFSFSLFKMLEFSLRKSGSARVSNISELKGAHFRILPKKVAIFAKKNVRFLYYKEANKKRHMPLKVAPQCAPRRTLLETLPTGD